MDRRLITFILSILAIMAVGAALAILDRPTDYLAPLAGHFGAGGRALPIEALLAAPAGLLLNVFFVALRMPKGDSENAVERRRWSGTFLAAVTILFGALEAMEIGVLYGWFPADEQLIRLLFAAAAIWMVFAANGAAKLIVLGRDDAPASPRRLALNRFGALIGLVIGALLIPVSLLASLPEVVGAWLIAPTALALLFMGRVVILALDSRSTT
jgi:hypothetical protein